ncbi:VWA-like domain-containing protein [uncultured Clostridium sp.]|uniref:vWA domain-containing protein n=1 Tax=uncultured Clostridium sp. TaxID=59620 RepID=UPI0026723B23|nr:VWA-like domain-containing protein [uncultured Clostridium sp.]
MESYFERRVNKLYQQVNKLIDSAEMYKAKRNGERFQPEITKEFKEDFFKLVDKVILSLMEDKDNFYGYFLFQMGREIRFDITSASGVNFKGAKYVIYFNPILFLQLNMKQMETTIKHEIHHVLSLHLSRAKELKNKYSTLTVNLAMDIVVNQYLDNLPPYSTTLKGVNLKYNLNMEAYNTLEYYAEKIQSELDLMEENDEGEEDDSQMTNSMVESYNPEKMHDMWQESDEFDEKTLREFAEKVINASQKGTIPSQVESLIANLKNSQGEIPWNIMLKKLMGTVESNKKKTITRRNRRQPNRLDLRGEIRNHKSEIAVAIDISGSISNEEFKQAIKEVLSIVKNYNHEITIIECDKEVKRVYKAKSVRDIKKRLTSGGATKFTPVFEYANNTKCNLLIYFTDGKGERKLEVVPRGYRTLWVISGRGDELSLDESYGPVKKLSNVEVKDTELELKDVKTDGYSMNNQEPIF